MEDNGQITTYVQYTYFGVRAYSEDILEFWGSTDNGQARDLQILHLDGSFENMFDLQIRPSKHRWQRNNTASHCREPT
jgi:hypothetical protein